jgi:outer membrane protein assembly factor BamB
MRRILPLLPVSSLMLTAVIFSGAFAQDKIDRKVEDGIEVIFNHLQPYKIKGEPTALTLERLFSIDTENDDIAKIGLTDIESFDVDPAGNIYLIRWRTDQNHLYKFDAAGRFLKSFLRGGQGPGEIEWGGTVLATDRGEIIAKDPSKGKFLVYDKDGNFVREVSLPKVNALGIDAILANGSYLVSWQKAEPEDKFPQDYYHNFVGIASPDFKDIKEIGDMRWPNPWSGKQVPVYSNVLVSAASRESVFVANAEKGYEISVYHLDGKLARKIRKEYGPLKVPDEIKKNYGTPASNPRIEDLRKRTVLPDRLPPFRSLFADDEGRIYVMTWEKGKNPREYMHDIFNPRGLFMARTSLDNYTVQGPFKREYETLAIAKKGRLYCLHEKESGFKELLVYKMNWQ